MRPRFGLVLALLLAAVTSGMPGAAHALPCSGFNDVDAASTFCPAVDWMRNRNVSQGCAANLYCPNDPVSRLQMAAFLNRFASTMAAMHWVDASDVVVGRAGPEATLELTIALQRVLIQLEPKDPSGYGPKYGTQFEFEGLNCSGRRYFLANGGGNTGAKTLAVVIRDILGSNIAFLSGPVEPTPFIASVGTYVNGTLNCANLLSPGFSTTRHEAQGPYALPVVNFPLYLR